VVLGWLGALEELGRGGEREGGLVLVEAEAEADIVG